MSVTLRSWQARVQPLVLHEWAPGLPGKLVVACTGSGKTIFGLDTVLKAAGPTGRIVWLAHRKELLDAPLEDVRQLWPELARECGIVQGSRDKSSKRIVFASIQTLRTEKRRARLLRGGPFAVVVVDEAHHSVATSYDEVIRALIGPNTRVLGLTATPDRATDGPSLSQHWQIAAQYGIVNAVEDGVLLPPYLAIDKVPNLDLEGVGGRKDYDDGQLGRALLKASIVEHTVAALSRTYEAERLPLKDGQRSLTCRGRAGFVFTATVEQAELTAEALRADGWKARAAHGELSTTERTRVVKAFKAGKIDVLCNPAIFTEGTNLPRASFVCLARPTRSWSLAIQCVGRGLRLVDGKPETEGLILDLGGAMAEHSLLGAPVLIDTGCTVHEDGCHRYVDDQCGGGRCDCGKKVSCLANRGSHVYRPGEIHCSKCGREKCPESPNGDHLWIPQGPLAASCAFCPAKSVNPLAGLVNERDYEKESVDWRPVAGMPGVYGVQLHDLDLALREAFLRREHTQQQHWPAQRTHRHAFGQQQQKRAEQA